MSDLDHKRKPEPSTDRQSSHVAKRRKVSKQEERLVKLLKQLDYTLKSAAILLDSTNERFTPPTLLKLRINRSIPQAISFVLEFEEPLYSPTLLKAFSTSLCLPTEYEGLEQGMSLSIHFSDTEFQPEERNELETFIELANNTLAAIVPIYSALLKAANTPPPPSLYAQHAVWGEWQQKETAILCLRPSGKQGLALSLLHDIFRHFQLQARTPISSNGPHAAAAMCAAYNLCQQMGDSFINEEARTEAFESCVKSLFPESVWHHQHLMEAESEGHFGYFDASYSIGGILRIIREDNIEPGDGGDSYMQSARDYQLYISNLREKKDPFLMHGAPTFLLCVFGILPLLLSGLCLLTLSKDRSSL